MSTIKEWSLLLLLAYMAAWFDALIGPRLEVGAAAPEAFVLLAAVWLVAKGGSRGYLAAGAIGLLADLYGPGRVGVAMFSFAMTACAVEQVAPHVADRPPWLQACFTFPVACLLMASLGAAHWLIGDVPISNSALVGRTAGAALYTSLLAAAATLLLAGNWRAPRAQAA